MPQTLANSSSIVGNSAAFIDPHYLQTAPSPDSQLAFEQEHDAEGSVCLQVMICRQSSTHSKIQTEYPPSPLQSISSRSSPSSEYHQALPNIKSRLRRQSDSAALSSTKSSAEACLGALRSRKKKSLGLPFGGPNVCIEQKILELEQLEDLDDGGVTAKKERRKIQNRLAQRAFRARSKVRAKKVRIYTN